MQLEQAELLGSYAFLKQLLSLFGYTQWLKESNFKNYL